MLSNGVDAVDLPGVEHEDGRVLFVSRMEREKGVLDAISVLQALAEADPRVHGVMVGGGSLEADVRRAAQIERRAGSSTWARSIAKR